LNIDQHLAIDDDGIEKPPVGAHHAVEAIALAQKSGDDIFVKAESDFFDGQPNRPAVIRLRHLLQTCR
jgi:hypothetical protein